MKKFIVNRKEFDQYQDMVSRLYPELTSQAKELHKNSMSTMEITFQVTNACSLACSYCYQINKGIKVMSFDTAKRFIDNLFNDKYKGYVSLEEKPFLILDFIGGEPFLQPKLIEQICDYFYDKAIELIHPWAEHSIISVCTNGVHWFEPEVQHLLNKYGNRMSLSVTIDGDKELHDSCRRFPDGRPSYDLAWAAAQDWIKRGGYIGSKITIAPANLQYMNKAIKHFIEAGYTEINANTVYEWGWNLNYAKEFYQKLIEIADYLIDNNLEQKIYLSLFVEELGKPEDPNKLETWCGGVGNAMLAIDPDGNLYPCLRYMDSSLGTDQTPMIFGTVDDGMGQLEVHAKRMQCMSCITRQTEMCDECYYCPIGMGCAECAAYDYQVYGTPNHHCTYLCDMHVARCLANCYFWNKCYQKHDTEQIFSLWVPDDWALKIISPEELQMLKNLTGEPNKIIQHPHPEEVIEWQKKLGEVPEDYNEDELRKKFKADLVAKGLGVGKAGTKEEWDEGTKETGEWIPQNQSIG